MVCFPFPPASLVSAPQFCTSVHRAAVYNSMPHAHRRALHLQAASMAEVQLEEVVSGPEAARPLLRTVTRHLLRSVLRSEDSSEEVGKYCRMDRPELESLLKALDAAACNSRELSWPSDEYYYRVRAATYCSKGLLHKQAHRAHCLVQCLTRVHTCCIRPKPARRRPWSSCMRRALLLAPPGCTSRSWWR